MLVTEKNVEGCLWELSSAPMMVVDTETNGVDWVRNHICGVGVRASGKNYYFPFRHEEGPNLPENWLKALMYVLHPNRAYTGFHYSFDIKMLCKEGMQAPHKMFDAMLAAHLMNENEESFKMESLATKYIDPSAGGAEDELIDLLVERFGGSRKKAKGNLWRLPAEAVWKYACQDVETTENLMDFYRPHLQEWKLDEIFQEVCDYQLIITESEMRGLQLDVDRINELKGEAGPRAEEIKQEIQGIAGYACNPRSSKQMQALLEVPSTAASTLEHMDNPLAQLLLDYRVWDKAVGTYYNPYLASMDEDGVIHPNLSLIGTVTGRLSCRKPNLFAVPRDGDRYRVKSVYKARPGFVLVEADYKQAEMHVASHYSKDKRMTELLESGTDMHAAVAEEQNMPRDMAKRCNFSAVYGIGPRKFAKTYGVPYGKAKEYLKKWHGMFPGFRRLYNKAERKAEEFGYIRLFTGRLRHYNSIRSPAHVASSNIVQGGVAEMMRLVSMKLHKTLPEVRQLLQVYDSFIFEIPKMSVSSLTPQIKTIMEDQPWCSLAMSVDMKQGEYWGSAKAI